MNERKLIIEIKDRLDKLLEIAPSDNELDDDDVVDFYAEAQNLKEAIENLGY